MSVLQCKCDVRRLDELGCCRTCGGLSPAEVESIGRQLGGRNAMSDAEQNPWKCTNPDCGARYAEYVNGCPRCSEGAPGKNWPVSFDRPIASPPAPAPQAESNGIQQRVHEWILACFGPEIARDRIERNHRFLEEALELVQACGCTESEAHQLVDYAFGREVGHKIQEVGGVVVTLAALCSANDVNMETAGEQELTRVWEKIDKIRAKQAAKPKHSPLPASVAAPQAVWNLGPIASRCAKAAHPAAPQAAMSPTDTPIGPGSDNYGEGDFGPSKRRKMFGKLLTQEEADEARNRLGIDAAPQAAGDSELLQELAKLVELDRGAHDGRSAEYAESSLRDFMYQNAEEILATIRAAGDK